MHIYLSIYRCTDRHRGARNVMVIEVGNEHNDPTSNHGQDYFI